MTARRLLPVIALLSLVLFAACVPESDIDRAAGESAGEDTPELTPIAEEDLPELPEVDIRTLSVNHQHGAGETVAEISVTAGSNADLDLGDIARVEWSDGEVVDALPHPGESLIIESRRNDPEDALEPVRVILSDVSLTVGSDPDAEIRADEIETEWGTFPVLDVDSVNRPPGWKLHYQAAGQRWISEVQAFENGRARNASEEDLIFDDGYRPITAALRFDHQIEDLEAALPLPAEADIRIAIEEVVLEL